MKRNIILCILAFVLILFESVICRYIGINGVYPEVMFAFVICVSVLDDDLMFVTALSVVCGLVTDCLGGGSVGAYLFAYGICAVLCNYITVRFFMPNIFIAIAGIVLSALISRFLIFVFGFVIFGNANLAEIFNSLILQYVLYDAVITVVLYLILQKTVYSKKMRDRR